LLALSFSGFDPTETWGLTGFLDRLFSNSHSPLIATVISPDGVGRSAMIEIVAARETVQ
jgi:hypothetical protein